MFGKLNEFLISVNAALIDLQMTLFAAVTAGLGLGVLLQLMLLF